MAAITCSPGLVKLVKVVKVVAITLDVLVGGWYCRTESSVLDFFILKYNIKYEQGRKKLKVPARDLLPNSLT